MFQINGKEVTGKKHIANGFNEFFAQVGSRLAADMPVGMKSFSEYMHFNATSSMFLDPTCADEVSNIVMGFKDKKSCGYDGLPMFIIKRINNFISTPLAHICNLTFLNGVFPDKMKIAKIIPLFKSGDSSLCTNYRPVSLLPQFSKILEKLFNVRLVSFLNRNNIIYNGQYGFRKDHSTAMALLDLVEEITNAIDSKKTTVGIFIDLKKPFDTVNHDILLQKLRIYGIRGQAISWLQSYLTNRKQYVHFNGSDSDMLKVLCGVPQGSILGPILFLIYINDICNVSHLL